jgi:hypothetical protein
MNVSIKSIASWTVFLLMIMQFVPLNRINPVAVRNIPAPETVGTVLEKACYDCHSNKTAWKRAAYIAPVSWLASHVVSEGRNALNFSDWNSETDWKILARSPVMHDITTQPANHHGYYYLWNPDAKLSPRESALLASWAVVLQKEQQAGIKNSAHSRRDKTL